MEARAERRCARCKKLSQAMLKNRQGHHSDDTAKRGYELRCEKIALCIAAFRVAALWCTKPRIVGKKNLGTRGFC